MADTFKELFDLEEIKPEDLDKVAKRIEKKLGKISFSVMMRIATKHEVIIFS